MGLIDYGPHKLCTKHKHKIPELIKCVYCELEDVSTLDLADTLKIKQLEKERDELRDKVKWFDQVLSGNSKRLVSKIKRLDDEANEYLDRLQEAHNERDELKANWEGLKTELKNAAKLDVLFGEEDEVAKVSVVATLNIMSKLEGGKG